ARVLNGQHHAEHLAGDLTGVQIYDVLPTELPTVLHRQDEGSVLLHGKEHVVVRLTGDIVERGGGFPEVPDRIGTPDGVRLWKSLVTCSVIVGHAQRRDRVTLLVAPQDRQHTVLLGVDSCW